MRAIHGQTNKIRGSENIMFYFAGFASSIGGCRLQRLGKTESTVLDRTQCSSLTSISVSADDGHQLEPDDLRTLVKEVVKKSIPNEQGHFRTQLEAYIEKVRIWVWDCIDLWSGTNMLSFIVLRNCIKYRTNVEQECSWSWNNDMKVKVVTLVLHPCIPIISAQVLRQGERYWDYKKTCKKHERYENDWIYCSKKI